MDAGRPFFERCRPTIVAISIAIHRAPLLNCWLGHCLPPLSGSGGPVLSVGLGGAGAHTRGESPGGVILGLGTRITRITAGQSRYHYPHHYPHRTRIAPASPRGCLLVRAAAEREQRPSRDGRPPSESNGAPRRQLGHASSARGRHPRRAGSTSADVRDCSGSSGASAA